MADGVPSLMPMIKVNPPSVVVAQPPDLWPWLALIVAGAFVLLLIWRRWRLWLWWQHMRVNERTAQMVARKVYGRLRHCLPEPLSCALQRIAFAPHVSHETVRQLKKLLREIRS